LTAGIPDGVKTLTMVRQRGAADALRKNVEEEAYQILGLQPGASADDIGGPTAPS